MYVQFILRQNSLNFLNKVVNKIIKIKDTKISLIKKFKVRNIQIRILTHFIRKIFKFSKRSKQC